MLTEKRYEVILNLLNEKNSVTVTEIKELLGISGLRYEGIWQLLIKQGN